MHLYVPQSCTARDHKLGHKVARKLARVRRSRRGPVLLLALGAAATLGAGPVIAADSSSRTVVSRATSSVLSGTIAGTSLDTVPALGRTSVKNRGGALVHNLVTPDPSAINHSLHTRLAALKGRIADAVPELSLTGPLEQEAQAAPSGAATSGVSGGGLTFDISALTGAVSDSVAQVSLGVGAVAARAHQRKGVTGAQSGSCTIAGLEFDLLTPLLSSLLSQLTTALQPIATLSASLTTTLNGVLSGLGLVGLDDVVPTGVPDLTTLTDLPTISLAGGAIVVDLTTGGIAVDLAKLLAGSGSGLCAQANGKPVEDLLSALTEELPNLLFDTLDGVISDVLEQLTPCPSGQTDRCIGFTLPTLPADLPDGLTLSDIHAALTTQLTSTLAMLVASIQTLVDPLLNGIAPLLDQLADAVGGLLDLTTNAQSTTNGRLTETALQLDVLDAAHATGRIELELASTTVGPSAAASTTEDSTPPRLDRGLQVDAGRAAIGGDTGIGAGWLLLALLSATVGVGSLIRRTGVDDPR